MGGSRFVGFGFWVLGFGVFGWMFLRFWVWVGEFGFGFGVPFVSGF